FVRDTSADKLSSRAVPCVFLGFVPNTPGWQFYHATSHRVLPSQDVTFDESVPYYRLFPYRTAPLPPPPLFLAPGAAVVDPLPPQGSAPSGVSQVDPVGPVEVAIDSRPAAGAEPGGAESGGAVPVGAEPGGAEPGVVGVRVVGVVLLSAIGGVVRVAPDGLCVDSLALGLPPPPDAVVVDRAPSLRPPPRPVTPSPSPPSSPA
ncbi:unnamed protein product, partial [Closterium sp. NIES-54]